MGCFERSSSCRMSAARRRRDDVGARKRFPYSAVLKRDRSATTVLLAKHPVFVRDDHPVTGKTYALLGMVARLRVLDVNSKRAHVNELDVKRSIRSVRGENWSDRPSNPGFLVYVFLNARLDELAPTVFVLLTVLSHQLERHSAGRR